MAGPRKKLIEVALPLEAINAASAKEKSIRHGHPSTLHLWWARRPLAACRAVLFGQLVDDPSAWPERFPTPEAVSAERERLHQIIKDMVPWSASNDEAILGPARWEIARSIAWGRSEEPPAAENRQAVIDYLQEYAPPVYDPFCGGGSIPLEAQRLGLRAIGSDLNPVAVLISKATVEMPPKFAGRPPVNPEARSRPDLIGREWKGAQGLAEDVRYYGRWMRNEAQRRIGHLYPKARLPDGSEATVIAWLWARTVRSPDPAARGAHVPLISTFMLSSKAGRKAWLEPVVNAASGEYRFDIKTGALSEEQEMKLRSGTKAGRGANFTCLLTGAPITNSRVKAEATRGQMGIVPLAIVAEGSRGRVFLPFDTSQLDIVESVPAIEPPMEPLHKNSRYMTPTIFGLEMVGDLFLNRQIVALNELIYQHKEIKMTIKADLAKSNISANFIESYENTLLTLLALCVSKQANRSSTLCFWHTGRHTVEQVFARQALSMTWDFAEGNPFSSSTGNFVGQVDYLSNVIASCGINGVSGEIVQHSAQLPSNYRGILVSTDPPYYDNVPYADISDFFYVWLRKSAHDIYPELFSRILTPKDEELVAFPDRHGTQEIADVFFLDGMKNSLVNLHRSMKDDIPACVYYAFRQSEGDIDAISSPGWTSFLEAMMQCGFAVDGTWPVRTELTGNLKKKKNALSFSIVHVCRKRKPAASLATRDELIRTLRREMPAALHTIRAAGVGPVDMAQAAIGPGMAVFSRYKAVLEDSGEKMPVRTALTLINQIRDEIDHDDDAAYDAETRFALDWFGEAGWEYRDSGRAILLANAKNLALDRLSRLGLIETPGGRTRLTPRDSFDLAEIDRSPVVWLAAQHLAHALVSPEGGQERAAEVLAGIGGGERELVRALAYRLYGLAERKGWAQEALVWNRLAEEWDAIEDIAETLAARPPGRGTTPDLFGARP